MVRYANVVFADTYRYLPNRNDILILTDSRRQVIAMFAPDETLRRVAHAMQLRPGASFQELSCGTNALDLALRHRCDVILPGDRHYCDLFRPWCWVATPIFDTHHRVVACLGIALPYRPAWLRSERLALARLIAKELEHASSGMLTADGGSPPPNQAVESVTLSPRQRQVLSLFAQGMSYKQIARQIGITSTKTVEEHLDAVRDKLKTKSRRACIKRALDLGLL